MQRGEEKGGQAQKLIVKFCFHNFHIEELGRHQETSAALVLVTEHPGGASIVHSLSDSLKKSPRMPVSPRISSSFSTPTSFSSPSLYPSSCSSADSVPPLACKSISCRLSPIMPFATATAIFPSKRRFISHHRLGLFVCLCLFSPSQWSLLTFLAGFPIQIPT